MTDRWTWHGGGLAAARAHFGDGDAPWLDLSTGINPHGWPGCEAAAMAVDWNRLPDERGLRDMEAAAAAYFGAQPDHVCALPGTEIGLRLIGDLLPGPARYLAPSYRSHGEIGAGAMPVGRDALGDADGATLILANPNNPDGWMMDRETLLRLLDRRGPEGWLIVDEAFADTTPRASLAADVGEDRRLVLFRSFGKFFGLAGVRLGFLIGPRPVIAAMRRKLGAWPVSAAAIAIGAAACRDQPWIGAMRRRLHAEAERLDAALLRSGHRPIGACPLFRLIETDDAMALFERLARRSILTRPFDYQPRWLRLGLPGDAEALERLETALRHG
ncbi:MAG: threonine-phosphate decarboxylase CobD [Sphingobium sp.]